MRFRDDRRPGPGRRAPSWWRTAREASDPRSVRAALTRLGSTPADLVGPEPSAPPPGDGRFRWLRPYRRPILWLAAALMFGLSVQTLSETSELGPVEIPAVSLLIALPLGLAATMPLRAWWLQMLVAAALPLIAPAPGTQGPPWPPTLVFVALYVVYAVAVRLELHLLAGVWLVTGAVVVWSYLAAGHRENPLGEAGAAIFFATVLIAYGYLVGTRRRLQRQVVEGLQRQQQDQAARALLEERARIARELHDVVAHHMSVIAVRAETAPFRIPDLPQAARDDMAATSALAREALAEMRRLLGVLRGADSDPERAPQPGLERLDALLAGVRGAGLAVDLEVAGDRRPLPAGVELSAYRILQEALSNSLRHAPGARATVAVGYEPDRLRLRIHNDAPPDRPDRRPPAQPGQGIIGMRERAAMLAGDLSAGPTPDGGYLVEAVLPLPDAAGQVEPP
jgi:signal transduction histidine kinase